MSGKLQDLNAALPIVALATGGPGGFGPELCLKASAKLAWLCRPVLFGDEEQNIIRPAIVAARNAGINVEGPVGADTMLDRPGVDAFIAMLHDQGHIPAKPLAPRRTAGLPIGGPILFSSVAHGSGHDIAGRNLADPVAIVEAVRRLVG